ncbi:MAG: redoxin domain-containing protein [Ignavibacteria bacterium]|nr:redoxin domain-containing protein [Ignavibacteria bacterium]
MGKSKILLLLMTFICFAKGPGDKADDFTITNTDGKKYNLSEAISDSRNGVVLMFWSTSCPWVQPYNDRINDYVDKLVKQGFVVWGINSNHTESPEEVISHAQKNSYSFPMLKDINNVVADMLNATRTPEVFLIGKDMIIKYHGRISDNRNKSEETVVDLINAANEVAEGKEVSVKETKQFGCTIKRVGQDH